MNDNNGGMRPQIKVSIIEDSKMHIAWLEMELARDERIVLTSINTLGRDGIEAVKSHKPDLVLLDFQLRDMTGLEVLKRIKAHDENIKVFIMTALAEISILERLISDKNIDGIAIKGSHYLQHNFLTAINHVAGGSTYLDPSLLTKLRDSNKSKGLSSLTKREFEVFIQINTGKIDEKIASDLCVEIAYIKNIKSKIVKKIRMEDIDSLLVKLAENASQND